MSRRTSILKALSESFKVIDGNTPYKTNLYNDVHPKLRFWDEISSWPAIYMSPGMEYREYLPGGFKWGFINISLKLYVKGDEAQDLLEDLIEDVERVIDSNQVLVYDTDNNYETTDMNIQSITTDEGLLSPYGVGEVNIQVRYAVM